MKKVGLDPGHGLYTPGKQTPTGIKEWTLNDKIRDKVVAFLADYDCEFVHVDNNEGNTDESLTSRVNKYLFAGVEVLVSLHHNAFTGTWNKATGVEVWVDRNATADDMRLAECIYKRLVEYTGLTGRGIKKEDFAVINQNKIPAVLIEGGFMDSSIDYDIITSDEGQTAYARAVAEGLIEYLDLKKKTNKEVNDVWYKVQVGAFKNKPGAEKLLAELESKGYKGFIVTDGDGDAVAESKPYIKEGSKVKVKSGAKSYEGASMSTYVYNNVYTVDELKGDRAVLDKNGLCTAFHIDNLILI